MGVKNEPLIAVVAVSLKRVPAAHRSAYQGQGGIRDEQGEEHRYLRQRVAQPYHLYSKNQHQRGQHQRAAITHEHARPGKRENQEPERSTEYQREEGEWRLV